METRYCRRKHPLILCDINHDISCTRCKMKIQGPVYACKPCEYFLHKSCARLPKKIHHRFHPCHSLTLYDREGMTIQCNSCYKTYSGFTYSCECRFNMDIECALMAPIEYEEGREQIQHFSHQHPLILIESEEDCCCYACNGLCLDSPIYGCISCEYYIHKSCSELPRDIQHIIHPCPLILCTKSSANHYYDCEACRKPYPLGFLYQCERCQIYLDLKCALTAVEKYAGNLANATQLTLDEKRDDDGVYCLACRKICSGLTYSLCSYFLHKSCAELPKQIQHPFHPLHSLTLIGGSFLDCNACRRNNSGYAFHCEHCSFDLHVDCAFLKPTIKFQGHSHLLTFIEYISNVNIHCNACGTVCESSVFRCVECDFSLHLLCGPLPCTIKHECHMHSLSLMDFLFEDGYDEQCCDVCENERDPRVCVYYCEECNYVAHVSCVISEVVHSIRGELGEVELRTVDTCILGKANRNDLLVKEMDQIGAEQHSQTNTDTEAEWVDANISFKEILDLVTIDEQNEIMIIIEPRPTSIRVGDIFESSPISPYSEKAFTPLMEKLDSGISVLPKKILLNIIQYDSKLVMVCGYKIAQILAPVLKMLFTKYGNISAESMLSPAAKCIYLHILCAVVHSMCKTRVLNINKTLLFTWWANLQAVQRASFKVQFAIDHLKLVSRAYFGLEAKRIADETLARQEREIAQLTQEMQELATKLEAIKMERKQHVQHMNSMKECLSEASKMKWKTADEGLL